MKRPKLSGLPGGWVEVAVAPDGMAAGMLEGLLKNAGIPVMVWKPPLFPYLGSGGVHTVLVPAENRDEARELLSGFWDAPGGTGEAPE